MWILASIISNASFASPEPSKLEDGSVELEPIEDSSKFSKPFGSCISFAPGSSCPEPISTDLEVPIPLN